MAEAEAIGIYGFITLDLNERAQMVWEKGKYIASRLSQKKRMNLYSLEDYYVEIEMLSPALVIVDAVPFLRGHRLDKYLDDINIKL
jgi:hypothetical protein